MEKIVDEAVDAKSFYLKPQDGTASPTYLPGQYLTLCLKTDEAVTAPRHYTISSATPVDGCVRITVKHAAADDNAGVEGIVSSWLHNKIKQGDVVDVRPPFGPYTRVNNKWDQEVYVTAGSGVTPAIAMMGDAVKSCPKVAHFHADRDEEHHALRDETNSMNLALAHFTYDNKQQSLKVDQLLKELAAKKFNMDGKATGYHVSGPLQFVNSIVAGLKESGVDASCVRHELYGPDVSM